MRIDSAGRGYRPAGRTARIGSSTIRVIPRPQPPTDERLDGKLTFIPGGSARSGQFPELERLEERFHPLREPIPSS